MQKAQLNLNQGLVKLTTIKNKILFSNFAKYKRIFKVFFTSPFKPSLCKKSLFKGKKPSKFVKVLIKVVCKKV
ncbi:hypothetical protein DMC01_01655 [Campylobacter troglodytis]|nr:hypothetical protein DMC01_01655 [Campylobacter troglodytis]